MSIQMSLVFSTLIGQMVVLFLLVLPLPHPIRAKIVDITWFLQKSKNFKVGVVFSIILLVLQFLDCVSRLKRISEYSDPFFVSSNDHRNPTQQLTYDQLATKFYSQRNLYLSGAVLYLMLAIGIVITIVRKLVKKESEYRSLLAGKKTKFESEDVEVEKYNQLINLKEQDIKAFKKQLSGLQTAYDSLSPEEQKASKKSD